MYGVGNGHTMGMVNAHDIRIEGEYFAVQSQVMPEKNIANSCLLGLDFLKQYKTVIDIANDSLTLEMNGKKVVAKLRESAVGVGSETDEVDPSAGETEGGWNVRDD